MNFRQNCKAESTQRKMLGSFLFFQWGIINSIFNHIQRKIEKVAVHVQNIEPIILCTHFSTHKPIASTCGSNFKIAAKRARSDQRVLKLRASHAQYSYFVHAPWKRQASFSPKKSIRNPGKCLTCPVPSPPKWDWSRTVRSFPLVGWL